MDKISILLADDHNIVREALSALLNAEPDFQVVGEAGDGLETVSLVEKLHPQVLVLDLMMSALSGLEVLRRVKASSPQTQTIILSMHAEESYIVEALRAGARGYVLKGAGVESLAEAVRTAARGDVYLSPGISDYVLQGYLAADQADPDPLTSREREVLQLVAEGHTGRQAAARLGLSPKTVDNHRGRIMEKLGIHTTAGLVRYAMRIGLVR